ncbi:hypothetical protein A2U01_0096502, partial [Trifolium medium]|nr:hypothetical protein [Trifolium medium]
KMGTGLEEDHWKLSHTSVVGPTVSFSLFFRRPLEIAAHQRCRI